MIWLLLALYQIKHFVADYLLQGKYMLGKFKPFPAFILPLTAHCAVHAVFTFLIAICFKGLGFAIFLALLDAGIHFAVDRVKASPEMLGRFQPLTKGEYPTVLQMSMGIMPVPIEVSEHSAKVQWAKDRLKSNVWFWWSIGLDQMAHHFTHYFIIWMLL